MARKPSGEPITNRTAFSIAFASLLLAGCAGGPAQGPVAGAADQQFDNAPATRLTVRYGAASKLRSAA